ncbi:hypothetical protein [Nocardia asiatica]|uniref:hypothetical protein n=1 Tax=Nocardia asiatica TaxID=209252 RepID=UPI0002F11086|nr:hypothetical protein [Nocardia asiatica]
MTRQLRDATEDLLRRWNSYELGRGAHPVVDYDCHPATSVIEPVGDRLEAYQQLTTLAAGAAAENDAELAARLDADIAYCCALLGERLPLDEYIHRTQGCMPTGWTEEYIAHCGEIAREHVESLGVTWGPNTMDDLMVVEGSIAAADAADAIREAAADLEPVVRAATSTTTSYDLKVESVDTDAYWSYWLDGEGRSARLRINLKHARFSKVRVRQFALHEVLGHALQFASLADHCADSDVAWVRVFSVHSQAQVMFEGVAQALPLLVVPQDQQLATRVRLDHYQQLVRAQLHLRLAHGTGISDLVSVARHRAPFWPDSHIADLLTDRGANPLLRSYLFAYPAGIDWFTRLADTPAAPAREVLHAIYQAPHTPQQLMDLWPAGPTIGGE